MSTNVTIQYEALVQGGLTTVQLRAALAAVPVPLDTLAAFGVGLLTDTVGAPNATRTIVLSLVPTTNATATAQLQPGEGLDTGSPISGLTLTAGGHGYVAVPDVVIADTPLPLAVQPKGYVKGSGAKARATLNLFGFTVETPGALYAVPPLVVLTGGLGPGGVQGTAHATVAAGLVTGVIVDTPGSGYVAPPTVTLIPNPSGSGATALAVLQVNGLTLLGAPNPSIGGFGKRYTTPTVTIVPKFLSSWPDSSGVASQAKLFANILKSSIERALCCPVFAAAPVVV
jgi:hypothetical protein